MIIFIFYKIHNNSKIYSHYSWSFLTFPNQILLSILLFSHTTTIQSQIAFHLYKRKKRPSDWKAFKQRLFSSDFIRIKTIYSTNLFLKQKYCDPSDFIIAVMGKSNRCEIEGVRNLFPTPSLKLGSDWDYRLNLVPHYSYYKNVRSLF